MNKYDIHTHILPQIDDGSSDVDISIVLLEELENQGVTHLAFTPHFYSQYVNMTGENEESEKFIKDYINTRKLRFDVLTNEYQGNMKFTFGSEVHMSENIVNAVDLSFLCYKDTNYLLAEMPYDSKMSENEIIWLETLISKFNIIPVLAHIERYPVLLKDMELLDRLKKTGCMMQINTQSLYVRGISKKVIKLINNGYIDFLGSDTHSTIRGCDYAQGFISMINNCEENRIDKIIENGKKIFGE